MSDIPEIKITIKPGVEPLRRRSRKGVSVPRQEHHPDRWWSVTREYCGIKLGAVVEWRGEVMRVRRIERLSERPYTLTHGDDRQVTVEVYREEFELISQGDGRVHSRLKND